MMGKEIQKIRAISLCTHRLIWPMSQHNALTKELAWLNNDTPLLLGQKPYETRLLYKTFVQPIRFKNKLGEHMQTNIFHMFVVHVKITYYRNNWIQYAQYWFIGMCMYCTVGFIIAYVTVYTKETCSSLKIHRNEDTLTPSGKKIHPVSAFYLLVRR